MTPALESPSGNDHAEASGAPEVPEEIIAHLQTENAAQKETIATLLAANAALMARVLELGFQAQNREIFGIYVDQLFNPV
jgi:hypothetical protein